jgi:predicted nucleotidyltransferase
MNICGIIAEYNPIHNGHRYHLQKSRAKTDCDYTVCLMSGSFMQRGEPTILDKWHRAKAAVLCGADLVLELPTYFATSSAENFAYGAVKIFDQLGIDCLSFGSEIDDLDVLKKIAKILVREPLRYKKHLKTSLLQGLSFPAARNAALLSYFSDKNIQDSLNGSNSILAIEYLKALIKLKSDITPFIVKRTGKAYNDEKIAANLSSATAIRKHIFDIGFDDTVSSNLPKDAFSTFESLIADGFTPTKKSDFFEQIIYAIRKYSKSELTEISEITEGLENKIKKAAEVSKTYDELISNIKSKRFTLTRIQRILINILLGIKKTDIKESKTHPIRNIKVLAYKKQSAILMSHFAKNTKMNLFHSNVGLDDDFFVSKDITTTDIYSSKQKGFVYYRGARDFTVKTLTD